MSHKIAKARRKFVHKIMPEVKGMPLSLTKDNFTGRFQGITAAGMNAFKKVNKYEPIPSQVFTTECRKYWYKLA